MSPVSSRLAQGSLVAALSLLPLLGACDSPGGGGGGAVFFTHDSGGQGDGFDAEDGASEDAGASDRDASAQDGAGAQDSASVSPDSGQTTGPAPLVDPTCLDGQYFEPLPDDSADIGALIEGYSEASYRQFIDQVLTARYPTGAYLVSHAVSEYTQTDCVQLFTQNATGSAAELLDRLDVVVHECGHLLDGARGSFSDNAYVVRPELVLTCSGGDSRARGGETVARSAITADEYDALLPDDFYKDTYLVGDGSEQGFNMLMEEAVQYINSLVTRWTLVDQMSPFMSTTARDGILTFMWYMERYLRWVRTTDKAAHDFILGDPCWRELILTVWGRGWQYLDETSGMQQLGIDDAKLEGLVRDQALIDEIDRVRQAHGCP